MTSPVLVLQDVRKYFGALRAVDGVSLAVSAGEIHALIGPNGAGKSTLVETIYGALSVDMGRISFLGQEITGLSVPRRMRMGVGRSFQISNLLMEYTVLENAMLAELARQNQHFRFLMPAFADSALRAGATALLQRVGIEAIADRRVADIAHGERRLLELTLAVAQSPKLLVLDEPMAGTSAVESTRMTTLIADFAKDAAVLLIEHDMDAVFALADTLSVLVEGKVIACGSPDEIKADTCVREAYLGESF